MELFKDFKTHKKQPPTAPTTTLAFSHVCAHRTPNVKDIQKALFILCQKT